MDQLNKVAADDSDADAVSKVGGEGKGVENVGDIDSDGSPRRFYHTVRVVYFSFKEPHALTAPPIMSLIKVEPSGLHEEGIEEEERPVAGGRPEQSGGEMKQEQPAAPKETSEPDIPSFRYVERGARMYNVPLAIYHSPRNTCASHRYMYHLCTSLIARGRIF